MKDRRKKTEQDAVKADDMRRKSFETFGETMKQKSVDNDEKQSTSKRRNTGSEMPKYVQVKAESGMAIRQQEIELRRKKLETNKKRLEIKCFIIKSNFDFNRKNKEKTTKLCCKCYNSSNKCL